MRTQSQSGGLSDACASYGCIPEWEWRPTLYASHWGSINGVSQSNLCKAIASIQAIASLKSPRQEVAYSDEMQCAATRSFQRIWVQACRFFALMALLFLKSSPPIPRQAQWEHAASTMPHLGNFLHHNLDLLLLFISHMNFMRPYASILMWLIIQTVMWVVGMAYCQVRLTSYLHEAWLSTAKQEYDSCRFQRVCIKDSHVCLCI